MFKPSHACIFIIILRKSPTGQDFAENVKQKVWLRIGLDDVEIVKSKDV